MGKPQKFLWLDFQLLAVGLSTSCVSNVLVGKLQKHDNITSCGGLCVLVSSWACIIFGLYCRSVQGLLEIQERCVQRVLFTSVHNKNVLSKGLKLIPIPIMEETHIKQQLLQDFKQFE